MTEQSNNESNDFIETNEETATAPKKVSLKDAIRNKLAQNKQQQINEKNNPSLKTAGNMTGKSQMTKKVNNQHRRTGGS